MTREEAIKSLQNIVEYWTYKPTEVEAAKMAITALRPVSREQVEKVWRGVWKHYLPPLGAGNIQCRCTKCGRTPDVETPFCAWCGAPMTDEAVEMVMEKINNMEEMTNEH